MMHNKARDIVEVAKGLVGVRYRGQGRSQMGLDCAGLIIVAGHLNGISNFDTTSYSNRPNAEEFTQNMIEAKCRQLPYSQLAHGDMLRLNTSGWPVHIAIYEVDENGAEWYIHAYLPHKQVTRDPLTDAVKQTISSVWRYPE